MLMPLKDDRFRASTLVCSSSRRCSISASLRAVLGATMTRSVILWMRVGRGGGELGDVGEALLSPREGVGWAGWAGWGGEGCSSRPPGRVRGADEVDGDAETGE